MLRATGLLLYSIPVFWVGLMAILLFSHRWRIFPASHMRSANAADLGALAQAVDLLHHLALSALVLGLTAAGGLARFVRNSLLEVLREDYIRSARASGVHERRVVWLHALRNAAAPLLQVFGVTLPMLLSGALVVEVVFSWPGLGRVAYGAVLARDYPLILATTAFTGLVVVLASLLADLLHAFVDPRVRDAT